MIMDLTEILAPGKTQKRGHICRYGLFFATKLGGNTWPLGTAGVDLPKASPEGARLSGAE